MSRNKFIDDFCDSFEKGVEFYIEPEEKIYNRYFDKTLPLKNYSKNTPLIVDLNDESGKVIGRKFMKKNSSPAYYEYFIWDDLLFFSQINKNITFIFPPEEKTKYLDKAIGFRFYDNNPREISNKTNYFTLVLKYEKKYDILEKNSEILDNKNNSFIIEELNCLSIMNKIISSKYYDEIIYDYPSTIIELLGFYYSAMFEKQNRIKFIEPFFPIINNKLTMKEAITIDDTSSQNTIFIEPIFFNQHVSILYFTYKNKIRLNCLVDSSLYHSRIILDDRAVFPREMRNNISIFPQFRIQNGPTSSIWFISQILFVLNYKNDIFNEYFDFRCINLVFIIDNINNLYKIDDMPLIYGTKEEFNSKSINISNDKRCFISHKIIFAPFLDICGFLNSLGVDITIFGFFIDEIKDKYEKIRDFICTLKYNKEYYELLGNSSDITDIKIDNYKFEFTRLKENFNAFIKDYIKLDYNKENMLELVGKIKNISNQLENALNIYRKDISWQIYEKERIRSFYRNKDSMFSPLIN